MNVESSGGGKRRSPSLFSVAALAFSLLLWALLAIAFPSGLQPLQDRLGDLAWRLGSRVETERRLILVDIDERSLQEVGSWPWSRTLGAQLMDKLAEQEAGLQIWDVVFADARTGDDALRSAVARHKPVLSQVFALPGQGDVIQSGVLGGEFPWATCPLPFVEASGFMGNSADVLNPQARIGHITPRLSEDGVVRSQPAVLCYGERAYGALGVAALAQAAGEDEVKLVQGHNWLEPAWRLQGLRSGFLNLPLQPDGDMLLPWALRPESFISVSAADVLHGRVPEGLMRGAWVLVGSSAFGLNDRIATPHGSAQAGMLAHAQLLVAAMDGRVPYTPRAHLLLQCLAVVGGLGLMVVLQRVRRSPLAGRGRVREELREFPVQWLPVIGLAWGGVLAIVQGYLLVEHGWSIALLPAAVAVASGGIFWAAMEHTRSRKQRDRLYSHLSSYLPKPVAASLALQPPSSAIKASMRQVTVMFADIRNFSAYCEERPPEEAAAVLHTFFSTATDIVQSERGVIEAFQGDAVLAVWYGDDDRGADESQHARHALQAAVRLQAAMEQALPDPAPAGLEPLALGIGLESGLAMAGSFGLASRRTHMILGRTVTVASRLVNMTADLSYPILVGEGLAAQVGASQLASLGTFFLDGMRVPHHIYAHPLTPDDRASAARA